jgi:hypothetical protein
MILKRVSYDDNHRLVTRWTPEITGAARLYDENWNDEVIEVYFKDQPLERVVIHEGDGVYLCNDEGRTIEVLSRLHTPCD